MINGNENETSTLNIITYNIFCRPSFVCYDEQLKRAKSIPSAIKKSLGDNGFRKLDVICFVEAFDHDVNDALTVELHKMGFKHSTDILDSYSLLKLKLINGGIRIFSRHKILRSEFRMFPFSGLMNLESYVGKGALGIKICKKCVNWHIIGTHLAAWDYGRKDRRKQMNLIEEFIDEMKDVGIIKNGEPIVVTGDFNIDAFGGSAGHIQDLTRLYEQIHAYRMPKKSINRLKNKETGSYSAFKNSLVGRDGDDRGAEINELLDYSLVVKMPTYKLNKYSVKILKPYKENKSDRGIMYKDTGKRSRNLSDHFPNLTKITVKFGK